MVRVFYSDITSLRENISIDEFCAERISYVNSITAPARKKQSIYIWKLLLKALDIFSVSEKEFCVDKGKWELKNSNIKFSLAHSNNIVVVAISDREVGVDVEMFSEKLLKVSKKLFPAQKIPKNKTENTIYSELWVKRECQIKSNALNKNFYSKTITDICDNKYLVGIVCDDKVKLEKIDL